MANTPSGSWVNQAAQQRGSTACFEPVYILDTMPPAAQLDLADKLFRELRVASVARETIYVEVFRPDRVDFTHHSYSSTQPEN